MTNANQMAAEILERGASGFGLRAAEHFLGSNPDNEGLPARDWQHHLSQRVLELSAAIAANDPEVFLSRIVWSRGAFAARGLGDDQLRESLISLNATVCDGLPEGARDCARSFLRSALDAVETELEPEDSLLDTIQPHHRLALEYLQTVLGGNVVAGMQIILDEIDTELSVADAITEVLLPAQREVGRLWHQDLITVAEEHLVTSTTQRLLAVATSRAEAIADNGMTVVSAAVNGNIHDVGIRAIAYLLEMAGWRSICLGGDVPKSQLPAAIQFFNADVVLLSCALATQIRDLRDSIATIRSQADHPLRVYVGGNAFDASPELWKHLGADGYAADAKGAVELAATSS
jgi:methanogenic corrinoid protein MtbC1